MKTSRRITQAAVWGPTVVVTLFGGLILIGLQDNRTRAESVTRSYRVVALLEEAVGSLKDAELAARAFIITGDTAFVAEYDAVPMRMGEVFDSLRGMVVDPRQRSRVEALAIAADDRLRRIGEGITARRTGQLSAEEAVARIASTDRVVTEATTLAGAARAAQQQLVDARAEEESRHARWLTVMIILGTLLAAGYGAGTSAVLRRYAERQRLTATEIGEKNEQLQEQASELEEQLEELQNQAAQLEEMQVELEMTNDELQEANAQVVASESRFRSMVENSYEIVTILGPDTTLQYESPAVEKILGYEPGERIGTRAISYVHPEDRERVESSLNDMLAMGRPVRSEFKVRHKGGSYRRLSATAAPLGRDIIVNLHDVTDLRESEERLRHSQKMEAVGRMAGGIAHDFNNLLTVIRGSADLALSDLPENSSVRSDLIEIELAADRATKLTRQLLTVSRQQVVQPEVLSVNDVIPRVEKMLKRTLGADIEFVTILDPESHPILIDPSQLEQVLMNLAINARDAMPTGGKLITETTNVEIDQMPHDESAGLIPPGSYLRLSLSDTGIGMSKETRERIFEPFFTTKPTGKGTGLGLSTVYGIVKQAGGFIWVYSEPDHGTTFKLYFPRTAVEAGGIEAAPAREITLRPVTILLVEDELAVRSITARMLERMGHTVMQAGNGEEALRIAEQCGGAFDLVLTDVVMPLMGGPQLVEKLLERWPQTRVVYASGYTDETIVRHGILEGGSTLLQKPFQQRTLAQKIAEVLAA